MNIKINKIGLYIFLAVIIITYFFIRLPELQNSFFEGTTAPVDFAQDYIAGRQLLAGKSLYPQHYMDIYLNILSNNGEKLDPRLKYIKGLNAHPPFTAIVLFPLWFLTFHNAILLWSLISVLCMLFFVLLLIKSENIPLLYYPLVVLFVLAWPPFQRNISVGQISILVTLFVIAGWYFLKYGKEKMSGIFIALATMLKFYPGLLILYFLVNKKYKSLLYSVIGVGSILILTFIVTKYDFFRFIFNILPEDSKYWGSDIGNLSINGFYAKLFLSVKAYYNIGVFAASENYFLKNLFLYVTVIVIVLYLALHIKKYTNDLGFSFFIILALLLSPICWSHYLTLLLLPLIVMIKELIKKNTLYEMLIFLTALFLISIDPDSVYFHKVIDITHFFIPGNPVSFFYRMTFYSAQFYGMVLLLILNFRLIKQSHKSTSEPPANQS